MELALPIVALGSLYFISNQHQQASSRRSPHLETFVGNSNPRQTQLPNVDTPSRNYPDNNVEMYDLDRTDALSRQDIGAAGESQTVYTDRFFQHQQQQDTSKSLTSLTGESVSSSHYQHANMTPYFGGKIRGLAVDENSYESTLDAYTGTGSQHITKREQTPLFEPMVDIQQQHGMPISSDFVQERMGGVLSGRMDGVKPFDQEQIAPGLGLGYENNEATGNQGFNNSMMLRETWQGKNVDELRTTSKPKSSEYSLLGFETAPHTSMRAPDSINHGIQEKNRPDTTFEMGSDRLFTSLGAYGQAPTEQAQIVQKYVNRNDTDIHSSYVGIAGADVDGSYSNNGTYTEPHKQQLPPVVNTSISRSGKGGASDIDYGGMNSINVLPNSRNLNAPTAGDGGYYVGLLGGQGARLLHELSMPVLDVFRPTKKTLTSPNVRMYGNASSNSQGASYIKENESQPAVTNRQFQNYNGLTRANINRGQDSTAYEITETTAGNTARNTQLSSYIGSASSANEPNKPTSYQAGYQQRNNETKSSVLLGHTPGGSANLFNNTGTGAVHLKAEDSTLISRREVVPTSRSTILSPSSAQLGQSSGLKDSAKIYETYNANRNNEDLLLQFLENPYTTTRFSK